MFHMKNNGKKIDITITLEDDPKLENRSDGIAYMVAMASPNGKSELISNFKNHEVLAMIDALTLLLAGSIGPDRIAVDQKGFSSFGSKTDGSSPSKEDLH